MVRPDAPGRTTPVASRHNHAEVPTCANLAWLLFLGAATHVAAQDHVAELMSRLQDPEVRSEAVRGISGIESPDPRIPAALKGALTDETSFVRLEPADGFLARAATSNPSSDSSRSCQDYPAQELLDRLADHGVLPAKAPD
jgi:hypothetical protein